MVLNVLKPINATYNPAISPCVTMTNFTGPNCVPENMISSTVLISPKCYEFVEISEATEITVYDMSNEYLVVDPFTLTGPISGGIDCKHSVSRLLYIREADINR